MVLREIIERLWRDLYSGCISFFYTLFYSFEDINLLNMDDTRDVYALHFVFIPIIQKHLDMFQQGWAHHSLRTEHNKSPYQLWITGLCELKYLNKYFSKPLRLLGNLMLIQ